MEDGEIIDNPEREQWRWGDTLTITIEIDKMRRIKYSHRSLRKMTWLEKRKSELKKMRRRNEEWEVISNRLIKTNIILKNELDKIKKMWYYRLYQFLKRLFGIFKKPGSGRGHEKIEKKEDQQKGTA